MNDVPWWLNTLNSRLEVSMSSCQKSLPTSDDDGYNQNMNTTTERKSVAVQAMHSEINTWDDSQFTVENVAARIRSLGSAIRSAKWHDACEAYASFVELEADNLRWAYHQGSVDFTYNVF